MARISYCAARIFDISNVAVSFSRHSVAEDGRGKSGEDRDRDRGGASDDTFDSRGRVISRETTSGNTTTTVYDAGGRLIGRRR
jgi:YD repeat-containing protein